MGEKAPGRLGILESAAVVLAVAVATLTMAQAEPGLRGCTTMEPSIRSDAAPAKPSPDADATDMLLHD